jgi:hypothetical protein
MMGFGMLFFFKNRRDHGWSSSRIIKYFITRGLIIFIIASTIINFGFFGNCGNCPGGGSRIWYGPNVLYSLGSLPLKLLLKV